MQRLDQMKKLILYDYRLNKKLTVFNWEKMGFIDELYNIRKKRAYCSITIDIKRTLLIWIDKKLNKMSMWIGVLFGREKVFLCATLSWNGELCPLEVSQAYQVKVIDVQTRKYRYQIKCFGLIKLSRSKVLLSLMKIRSPP